MGRSEELGTGVKNVFKYSKAYSGSDHIVFEENDVFIAKVPLSDVIYSNNDHSGKPEERINERINVGLNTLLSAIIRNPGIQSRNLSTLLNTNPFPAKLIIEKHIVKTENAIRAAGLGQLNPENFSPLPKIR